MPTKVLDRILSVVPRDKVDSFKQAVEGIDLDTAMKFSADDFSSFLLDDANKSVVQREFDRYTSKGIETGVHNAEEKLRKQMQDDEFPKWYEDKIAKEHPELKPDPNTKRLAEQDKKIAELEASRKHDQLMLLAAREAKLFEGFDPSWLIGADDSETKTRIEAANKGYAVAIEAAMKQGAEGVAKKYNLSLEGGDDEKNKLSLLQAAYKKALSEGRTKDALHLKREIAEASKE